MLDGQIRFFTLQYKQFLPNPPFIVCILHIHLLRLLFYLGNTEIERITYPTNSELPKLINGVYLLRHRRIDYPTERTNKLFSFSF